MKMGFGHSYDLIKKDDMSALPKAERTYESLMNKWTTELAAEIDRGILEKIIGDAKREEKRQKRERRRHLNEVKKWLSND